MFSNVQSKMTGWLGNAAIPSMPAMPAMPNMPAMPAMPSMPSIPGLRKAPAAGEEGIANEGLATSPAGGEAPAGTDAGADDEDRSRYIRYGPCINDGKEMVFF